MSLEREFLASLIAAFSDDKVAAAMFAAFEAQWNAVPRQNVYVKALAANTPIGTATTTILQSTFTAPAFLGNNGFVRYFATMSVLSPALTAQEGVEVTLGSSNFASLGEYDAVFESTDSALQKTCVIDWSPLAKIIAGNADTVTLAAKGSVGTFNAAASGPAGGLGTFIGAAYLVG